MGGIDADIDTGIDTWNSGMKVMVTVMDGKDCITMQKFR